MTINEMSNEQLMRYYICTKKQMKDLQLTIKQYEDELDKRFNNGTLVEGKEKENG